MDTSAPTPKPATIHFNGTDYRIDRLVSMQTQAHLANITKHGDPMRGFDQAPIAESLEHHLVINHEGNMHVLLRTSAIAKGELIPVRLATKFFLKKVAAPVFTRHHDSINDRPAPQAWERRDRDAGRDGLRRNNVDITGGFRRDDRRRDNGR